MSCINNISTVNASDESYVIAQQEIKSRAPKNVFGELIYSADKVSSFLLGTTLETHQDIKKVLFNDSAKRSYVYENSFNNALVKLLSEKEIEVLHNELRQTEDKFRTYDGKIKPLSKATKLELSEFFSSQFIDYVAQDQALEGMTPTQEKVFEFLYKFYDGLENNVAMFSATTSGSIVTALSLKFDRRQTEINGQMAQAGISETQLRNINEGVAAIFMDTIYKDAERENVGMDQILSADNEARYLNIYGSPNTFSLDNLNNPTNVFDEVLSYYVSHYKDIRIAWSQATGFKKDMLAKELKAIGALIGLSKEGLEVQKGLLAQNWDNIIDSNIIFLKKYDVNISLKKVGLDDVNLEEDILEEINSRDSIGIMADNQVNPVTRMNKELKLLLRTLPEVDSRAKDGGFTFSTNKVGLPKLSDFGQTIAVLYRITSNKPTLDSKLEAIHDHIQREGDLKFQVLLDRLKVSDATIGQHTAFSGELLLEFNTAMNNAENSYTLMQISDTGARNLINANGESDVRIVKDRWSQNFKKEVRYNYGKLQDGTFVLDLKKPYTTALGTKEELGKLFINGPRDLSQAFEYLELLGIKFTNQAYVMDKQMSKDNGDSFMELTHNLLKYLAESEGNISELYKEDQKGRLKELIELQLDSSKALGSLQFNGPTGKVYSISQKGFINLIADKLNQDAQLYNQLKQSPTLIGSHWAELMYSPASEIKMEIGVLMGAVNVNNSDSKDYSKMMKGDIVSAQVSSILDGFVPLIRTGNKKLEKTIRVGKPDYSVSSNDMAKRLSGYLKSEIMTANAIRLGAASNIKGIDREGASLQMFNDPKFAKLKPTAEALIANPKLTEEEVDAFVNNPSTIASLREYIKKEVEEVKAVLQKFNIIDDKLVNIGIDNNQLAALASEIGETAGPKVSEALFDKIAEQIFIIRQTSIHEQFKFLLGHPAVYGDIFKRTSGLVGPKKYPATDEEILQWVRENYSNRGNPNRLIDGKVRMVTMKEVTETSVYLDEYKDILATFGRTDLNESLDDAYTNMEIFDGGGLIHIDFYRLVRRLTSSWTQQDEEVYNKLIDGQPITREEIALFDPIKPQVLAQAFEDKIDIRLFNKFALFPIHPGLSKTVTDLNEGNSNVLDSMYQDMNTHNLDYIVMESATKVGAKKEKSTGQFSNLINEEGGYQPLGDTSSIQEYDLEYFGMQMDPKAKFGEDVAVGVQLLSMLPTNIFNNGVLAEEYKGTKFSEDETWEDAITRYHDINTELISREASDLASRLGFSYTPDGKFQFLGSLNKMRDAIVDEMVKRDIPENVQDSLIDLFTREVTFAGQLFEKNKIETLFNAIVTNTVVRRKTHGNMVVLQSNFGYEITNKAQKQSKDVTGNRKLKSYSKDIAPSRLKGKSKTEIAEMKAKAPTTAMEVFLPHHYREFLGQDLPPGTKVSIKALEAVGFRIPTEGPNSLEYIIIKDFLPQHAGNTIIVPSEIVAKSGADFDIDKLTLFFPNTQYSSNTQSVDVIPMIAASEAGATKLRIQDLNAYKAVWGKLLVRQPEELAKIIKQIDNLYAKRAITEDQETLSKIEKALLDIDAQIIENGFIELGQRNNLLIQPKAVLQNEMLFFIMDVLKHPATFPQLITPVGAHSLSRKAKEIDAIINPDKYEKDSIIEKPKTLHQNLSFGNIIETTYTMYQTLGGTGIVATSITHAAKAQRSGLRWNSTKKKPIIFNFKNYNKELSLSDTKSHNTDRYINNEMQQYITGYVDGEKDPFVMYVNAGQEGAAIHMLLLRSGVPLDDVLHFMSQPIITDYLRLKGTHQTMAMRAKGKFLTNEAIKNKLKARYAAEPSSIELDVTLLGEMLPLKAGNMSPAQHSYQRQILEDYLRYKTYADQLRNLQTVNAYDKTKLKNGSEVIDLQALAEVVKEDEYFKDSVVGMDEDENLIWAFEDRLVTESMLDPIQKVFRGTETLFKDIDLKNSKPAIRRFFVDKAKELIRDGVTQEDRVYILNKFDNFMLANIVHGARINGVEIRSMARDLFRGNASLPKAILQLQESGETNNLLIDNLLPMLDPHDEASFKSTTDNLKLIARKYDSYDLDQLTFAMQELKETNPDIYNKLLIFSILQSGFDFNPNSFKQVIPGRDILDITEEAFSIVNRMPNYAVDLPNLYEKFIDNNWDNSRIVKQIYLNSKRSAMIEKDYLAGTEFRGAKYVTLHVKIGDKNSDTYQSNFYKLDLGYVDGEIDLSQSGYRKGTKMGKRNRIIETGYTSLIPANINPVPYELAEVFSKEEAEKIVTRQKTLHISTAESEFKATRYVLSDGTKIRITPIQSIAKINAIMANKTTREMADIKSKSSLAKKAGFNDFAHMKEQLEGFTKNKNSATLYKIEVEETGSAIFEDETADLIDTTKEELLENSNLEDINKESEEC